MPKTKLITATRINSSMNSREELMMAIRTKGGAGGLRKTGLSNY